MSDDDWTVIVITDEAHEATRASSRGPFVLTGCSLNDGTWQVPVRRSTLAALDRHRFEDETLSDLIVRMAKTARGLQS